MEVPKYVRHFPKVQKETLCYTKNLQSEEWDMKTESDGTGKEDQLIKIESCHFLMMYFSTHPDMD